MQSKAPEKFTDEVVEASLPTDVPALKEMLPLSDVERIIREHSCEEIEAEDGSSTLFAIEFKSPEELKAKLEAITTDLVNRITSNMMAFGARRDLVDVYFDHNEGFVFTLTEKAQGIIDTDLKKNPSDDSDRE